MYRGAKTLSIKQEVDSSCIINEGQSTVARTAWRGMMMDGWELLKSLYFCYDV